MWKVDCEDFNHGFTPLELIREFIPWLEKARDDSAKRGIVFSINPWVTCNHSSRHRYPDGPPAGFQWRVWPDGQEAVERACPLSSGWRAWLIEAYRLYATTKPNKLWLEDDFKTFTSLLPAKLGCFCKVHMEAFSKHIGCAITREELVERMIRPGEPDPIRAQWLDFQGRIMVDICVELEKIVHAESPTTRLGQMNNCSIDGRWWHEANSALAGPLRSLARPTLAPYTEHLATAFLPDRHDMLKKIACLPEGTECLPELENHPFTPYSRSTTKTRLQLLLPAVLGHPGITMNLFDYLGNPTSRDPRIGPMLKKLKPMLDSIALVAGPGGTQRGVSIPFLKRYADFVHVDAEKGFDSFWFDGDHWAVPLQGSGIPIFINGSSPISAITGQASLRTLPKEEIERLLHNGLLLDGAAAAVLNELGYGEKIGVQTESRLDRHDMLMSAERDDWPDRQRENDPVYMTLYGTAEPYEGGFYPLKPREGARAVSTFVDPDHQTVSPGMVLFENDWGGRVATYPFDFSEGMGHTFMNWYRREQLQRVIGWLGRERIDLFADGGAWMMPLRRDYPEYIFIAVLNFETDPWDEVSLVFDCPKKSDELIFELLDVSGDFKKISPASLSSTGESVSVSFQKHVPALDCFIMRISWKA